MDGTRTGFDWSPDLRGRAISGSSPHEMKISRRGVPWAEAWFARSAARCCAAPASRPCAGDLRVCLLLLESHPSPPRLMLMAAAQA
jgi:hypothetical protein